jgi:putative ABC transport system ATP-binding protein
VAVARALVTRPSIILADEPTGNLDSKTGEEIMMLFEDLHKQGNTIILVTHEAEIAEHAYRTIRLRDGKIESDEPVKNRRIYQRAQAS